MYTVYGVAPSDLIQSAPLIAEFPSVSGRTLGAGIPVDCSVGLVQMSVDAIASTAHWCWKPAARGYLLLTQDTPASLLKNHLRQFRRLPSESGQPLHWPWFDARYVKLLLEGVQPPDLPRLFGPIHAFVFAANGAGLQRYQLNAGQLQIIQGAS